MSNSTNQLEEVKSFLKHIESLAFDRSAANVGETKAVNYIQEELRVNNINSHIEFFSWSSSLRYLMKTFYLLVFCYLLMLRLVLLLVLFYFIKYLFNRTRNISFVEKEYSKNLVSRMKASSSADVYPVIIFSAHYDSISSRIPYKIQLILFWIIRVIFLPYIALTVVVSIWLPLNLFSIVEYNNLLFYLLSIVSIIAFSVIVPFFLFLFTSNKSTGSIDNASGVALLIELAKIIEDNPLKNYDVVFLWSGAEEWGLKGSKYFCRRHLRDLKRSYDLDKSININVDMVGTYIGLLDKSGLFKKKPLNIDLNDRFKSTAERLNIPLTLYNKIVRPKSDYKSFIALRKRTRSKLQVCCFHSDKDSIYIHSYKDTPDKCSDVILDNCLNIIYSTILDLDIHLKS
jgi:hypothetical protein